MLNNRKLRDWIEMRMSLPPLADSFRLYHESRHGYSLLAQLAWEVEPAELPDHLERQISDEVTQHVDGLPGRQQYVVRSYRGDRQTGEFTFWEQAVTGAASEAASALAFNTPDADPFGPFQSPRGGDFSHASSMTTVQQMRHNEVLMRCLVDMATKNRERDVELIANLSRQVEKHQRNELKVAEMMEGMMSRAQERQLTQEKFDADEDRKERLLAKLNTYVLPEIAKRLGLPGMAPTGDGGSETDKDLDKVAQLFMGLDSKLQETILNELGEEEAAELLSVFERRGGASH
jgi:hypothetical protein